MVRSVWGFISSHALFILALTGGALLRLTTVLGYPGVLWFTGDSYFYLGRALRPAPSVSKTMGYPLMLQLLERYHSLTLIAVLQHLMGLAIGVMIYTLLRRAGLSGWSSTLVTVPILFDAYQIQLEHLLMTEALFMFCLAATITMMLWRDRMPWWLAVPAGLLLGYGVLVRSAGAPLLPGLFLVLLLRWPGWRTVVAFGAASALPVLLYMNWFHSEHGKYALSYADGLMLWGRTASFATCDEFKRGSVEASLCLDDEYKAQNLAPGLLDWKSDIPPRLLFANVASPESSKILRDFALKQIRMHPDAWRDVILDGLGNAFSGERRPYPTANTESLYHFWNKPQIFPGGQGWATDGTNSTALSDAKAYGRGAPSRVVQPYADRMVAYQKWAYLPGGGLAAVLVVGGVGTLFAKRRRRAVLLAWGSAAGLLVFPLATTDFDYRYVVPSVPFALLAAGLALAPAPPQRSPHWRTRLAERGRRARELARRPLRWWLDRDSLRRGTRRARRAKPRPPLPVPEQPAVPVG